MYDLEISVPTGSGKSMFLADVYGNITTASNGAVLYLPASPEIVEGTVRENIRLASDCIKDAAIVADLKTWDAVCAKRRIELNEDARSLSLGEKQFVAVVRAVLHRPVVLILDEALNSIDATSEREVLRYIHDALPATTIFLVSHRPLTGVQPNMKVEFG